MDGNSTSPITLDFVPTDIRIHFGNGRPVSCAIERRGTGSGTTVDFVEHDERDLAKPINNVVHYIDSDGRRWTIWREFAELAGGVIRDDITIRATLYGGRDNPR